VILVAHRGASALARENSLDAIVLAAQYRMDFAEVDIRASRDGDLLLVHDAEIVWPETGEPRSVADLDSVSLRALEISGRRPARLRDALATAAACGIGLYLELKDPNTVRPLAAMLRATPSAERPNLIIGSFQPALVAEMSDRAPEIPRSVLFGRTTLPEVLESCRATHAAYAHLCFRPITRSAVDALHGAGLRVMAPHTNHLDEARRFRHSGIDVIASDDPRLLRTLVPG
jgi:glycerophosphoryl diester phosphodiesterase